MAKGGQPPSASIEGRDYWWYSARADLLQAAVGAYVEEPRRSLDVGSADGPSVGWLPAHISLDIDPTGLRPGDACGSVLAMPFADESFDLVTAFDVLEHCEPEGHALAELYRVISPGGRLLMSVPAYQWAWTAFDDTSGHYRRYTRPRLRTQIEEAGFSVERCTHIFAGTFVPFVVERVARRIRPTIRDLPPVSPRVERLLRRLCQLDARWLRRGRDLPFGSSVVVAARRVT